MPADSIVKTLDVIKDIRLGILPGGVDAALDSLLFQTAEEGFRNRIVPTVAPATHAGNQVVVLAPTIEVITTKLTTLVRVNHHGRHGPSAPYRHHHGIKHQFRGHSGIH